MQEPDPGLLVLDPRYTAGLLGVDQDGRAVDLTRLGPPAADQLHDPGLAGLRRYQRNRAAHRNGTVEETDTDLPRPHLGRCPRRPSPPTIDAPDGRRPSRMSITRWSVRGLAQTVLTIGVFVAVAVAVGVEHLRDRLPHHGHRFVGHRWTRR